MKTTKNRTVLLFRCSDMVRAAGSKILAAFLLGYYFRHLFIEFQCGRNGLAALNIAVDFFTIRWYN